MATGQRLRGFVGQGMNGRRARVPSAGAMPVFATSGTGEITIRSHCVALIYMWGAGASGCDDVGLNNTGAGGGGGAALFARVFLNLGQKLSYSVGAGGAGVTGSATTGSDGGDSTVTLPDGRVLTAGGGKAGTRGSTGGLGGVATGGDINRRGGKGGDGVPGTVNGVAGEGTGAGAGGAGSGSAGGGGGAGGLADVLVDLTGGAGSAAVVGGAQGNAPGGGSGAGGTTSKAGAAGRIIILFVRMPA